ncbi:MAG: hypothetical protein NVSMB39_6770 [Candidatus Saccharimonadales bacterium]
MNRLAHPTKRIRETRRRSIVKSLIYRILNVTADVVVIYLVTHGVMQTIVLTIITNLASTLLYYGHERVWNAIRWGLVK